MRMGSLNVYVLKTSRLFDFVEKVLFCEGSVAVYFSAYLFA